MFDHTAYSQGGPGPPISLPGPHKDFSLVILEYGWILKT